MQSPTAAFKEHRGFINRIFDNWISNPTGNIGFLDGIAANVRENVTGVLRIEKENLSTHFLRLMKNYFLGKCMLQDEIVKDRLKCLLHVSSSLYLPSPI